MVLLSKDDVEKCVERVNWLIVNSGITAEEFIKRLTPKKELNAENT